MSDLKTLCANLNLSALSVIQECNRLKVITFFSINCKEILQLSVKYYGMQCLIVHFLQINEKLEEYAKEAFSKIDRTVTCLSSFSKFLNSSKTATLHAMDLTMELSSFKAQVEAWLKSVRKNKNAYNSQLRVSFTTFL